MEVSRLKPFSALITKKIIYIVIAMAILAGVTFSFFQLKEKETEYLRNDFIPQFTEKARQEKNIGHAIRLIENIQEQEDASQFVASYDNLSSLLEELNTIPEYSTGLQSWTEIHRQSQVKKELERFAGKSERNNDIKTKSERLLLNILERLAIDLAHKNEQLNELYKQITTRIVNDRVTANRAAKYANLNVEIKALRDFEIALIETERLIKTLSVNMDPEIFSELSIQIKSRFTEFAELDNNGFISEELKVELVALEKLLVSEELGLAKWKGYLRLAQPFMYLLNQTQSDLLSLESMIRLQASSVVNSNENRSTTTEDIVFGYVPQLVNAYIPNKLTHQQWQLVFLLAIATCLFALIGLITQLVSFCRKHSQVSETLCQQITNGEAINDKSFLSADHQQIAACFSQFSNPKYSEADYLALSKSHKLENKHIQQLSGVAFFTSSNPKDKDQIKLIRSVILGEEYVKTHPKNSDWRKWFDKGNAKQILSCLRELKKNKKKTVSQLRISSITGVPVELNIAIEQGGFVGTAKDISEVQKAEEKLSEIANVNQQQSQDNSAYRISRIEELQQLTTNMLLQNQSAIVAANIPSLNVHRKLVRIAELCNQELMTIACESKDHRLSLTDFNLRELLEIITTNLALEESRNKNEVFLNFDGKVSEHARLDKKHFSQLIKVISRAMLTGQKSSTLLIDCNLKDKNPGQQTVTFNFKFETAKNSSDASKFLNELLSFIEHKEDINDSGINRHLENLFSLQHIANIGSSKNQNGYSLHFDVPFAVTSANAKNKQSIDFKEKKILLIAQNNDVKEMISSLITESNGKVESLEKPELFVKTYNEKWFNRNSVALVIVSSEFYNNYSAIVESEIDKLPAEIRPKLFIMQPTFQIAFHKNDMYGCGSFPDNQLQFVNDLNTLINGKEPTNLAVEKKAFEHLLFYSTPTEVLVSVESLTSNKLLIRQLQWLGLQVSVVNDSTQMAELWETGRFLVLITEFSDIPNTKLSAGGMVKRCVFYVKDKQFSQKDFKRLENMTQWQIRKLPELEKVKELSEYLAPWLNPSNEGKPVDNNILGSDKGFEFDVNEEQVFGFEIDHQNYTELLSADSELELDAAFDIRVYANNQGSPELAAFMLDSYIGDMKSMHEVLSKSVQNKNDKKVKTVLKEILRIATIMAAADVKEICEANLQKIKSNKKLTVKDVKALDDAIEVVSEYAEVF